MSKNNKSRYLKIYWTISKRKMQKFIAVENNIEKSMKYNVNAHANIYTHTHIHNCMNECTHGDIHTYTHKIH